MMPAGTGGFRQKIIRIAASRTASRQSRNDTDE